MRSRVIVLAVVLALAVASGCRPALSLAVGVAQVEAATAAREAEGVDAPLILDVRARADYEAGHAPGAVSVPPRDLDAFLAGGGVPRGRRVVTACSAGGLSLLAAPTVRAHGHHDVRSLAGGMAAWRAAGLPLETGAGRAAPPGPHRVTLGAFHQQVVLVSGLIIKPAYMLLAFVLVVWLWRARTPTIAMIRRSLALFFVGEAICALDFLTRGAGPSAPLDWFHGLGMIGFGALLPWALFRLLDERVLRFVDPAERCVFQRFCGRCWKRDPVTCGPHRLFVFVAPALAVVALMPLTEPLQTAHLVARVSLSDVDYGLPVVNQILELRVYPIVACLLMIWTAIRLRGGVESVARAQLPFFCGLGVMGFSLFRFFLNYAYRDRLLWADFWEELTELVAVIGVGLLLVVFRQQLGLVGRADAATPAGEH